MFIGVLQIKQEIMKTCTSIHVHESYLLMLAPPTAERWGVWMAGFTEPMDSLVAARINLASIKPGLEERWRSWHEARAEGQFDVES